MSNIQAQIDRIRNNLDAAYIVLQAIGVDVPANATVDDLASLINSYWTEIAELLEDKVDKVSGKGLSTNDYTTAEQTKLGGIETGAQVNKIEKILVDGTEQTISGKAVSITRIKGDRGTGLLPVTTAPSSYTTAVNGLTPTYRIALSTVKTQASTEVVYAGDTLRYSYYHYPIIYVDES